MKQSGARERPINGKTIEQTAEDDEMRMFFFVVSVFFRWV